MSEKILVTGGNGLVGSAVRQIRPDATFVSRKDADLRDLAQVRKIFQQHQPKYVLHLAAKVGGVKLNAEKNADMFTENIQINTNVLSAAQEFKVEKFIGVLSSCTFRPNQPTPPNEKKIHEGMPFEGHRGYAFSKRMMDMQIQLLRKQYGSKFTTILPATIIGPNDHLTPGAGHVAGDLIQKCYLAKKNGTAFEVWGSGNAVRQFIFSFDVARILLEVLKKYDDSETVIAVPDDGITIRSLAQAIAKALGFKGETKFDTSKPEGELKRVLDGSKFRKLFPDFKFTSLEETIQKTAPWFVEQIEARAAKVQVK